MWFHYSVLCDFEMQVLQKIYLFIFFAIRFIFIFNNTDAYATYVTYNVVHTLLTMLYTVCHLRY